MLAIVVVFQLHVVVIDHAAGGDAGAFTVEDQIHKELNDFRDKVERTDAADAAHDERVAREMEKLERRRQRRADIVLNIQLILNANLLYQITVLLFIGNQNF